MRVEGHNKMRDAFKKDATRVVVYDNVGNPIMAAVEIAPNHIMASHAGDADFHKVLDMIGIKAPEVSRIKKESSNILIVE